MQVYLANGQKILHEEWILIFGGSYMIISKERPHYKLVIHQKFKQSIVVINAGDLISNNFFVIGQLKNFLMKSMAVLITVVSVKILPVINQAGWLT